MTGRKRAFFAPLTAGSLSLFLAHGLGANTVSNVAWCTEQIQPLCDALRQSDSRLRVEQGRERIREALFSPDQTVRGATVHLLASLSDQRDLRPYADVFEEFCTTEPSCFWTAERADSAELHFGPREERVDLLERAIRTGEARLPRGTPVPRWRAASLAGWQGLDELQPLAAEYLATLTDRYKKRLQLDGVSGVFELTGGAETETEALSLAAARIAAMPDEDFTRRMDEEDPFRNAVLGVGFRACDADILSGLPPPACGVLSGVVLRQKSRFPNTPFMDSDAVKSRAESLPPWRDGLNGSVGGRVVAAADADAPASETPHRRPRSERIDPCTVPEISYDGQWFQGSYMGKFFVVVRDLSGGGANAVSIADGIRGHKPGEAIRLKLDIRDRSGGRPSFPAFMRVVLSGQGSLSAPGQGQRCQAINLFWNRAASDGTSLVAFDEIDYTIGKEASLVGSLPDAESPGKTVSLWKATEQLRVQFGQFKDGGEMVTFEGDSAYWVRPEGAEPAQPPRPFESLLSRPGSALKDAEFFGPDLGEGRLTLDEPIREYVAMVDRARREDTRSVLCFSQLEGGTRFTQGENVTLRRLGATAIFVGSFLAVPAGYPSAETVPGRALRPPAVVIPLGASAVGCEDPPSRPRGAPP